MARSTAFPFSSFLQHLQALAASEKVQVASPMPPMLASMLFSDDTHGELTSAVHPLIDLLKARQAMHAAAVDTELVADELRRYQKFAKPGQPSPHIVQLRQKQAAARLASSQSRQRFNQTAVAFVRVTDIEIPERMALEMFMLRWIELHVPTDTLAG